jgi:hypothetical protein
LGKIGLVFFPLAEHKPLGQRVSDDGEIGRRGSNVQVVHLNQHLGDHLIVLSLNHPTRLKQGSLKAKVLKEFQ